VRWTHHNGLMGSNDTRSPKELVAMNAERASECVDHMVIGRAITEFRP